MYNEPESEPQPHCTKDKLRKPESAMPGETMGEGPGYGSAGETQAGRSYWNLQNGPVNKYLRSLDNFPAILLFCMYMIFSQ